MRSLVLIARVEKKSVSALAKAGPDHARLTVEKTEGTERRMMGGLCGVPSQVKISLP
jgi:hypothetical protein